jgi:hypothetical protein
MPRLSRTYHEIVIKGPVVAGGGRTKFWYKNLRRAPHQKCHINTSKTWQLKDLHAAIFFFPLDFRTNTQETLTVWQHDFYKINLRRSRNSRMSSRSAQHPLTRTSLQHFGQHFHTWCAMKPAQGIKEEHCRNCSLSPVQKDLKSASLHNESDPARTKRWKCSNHDIIIRTAPQRERSNT